MASMLSKRFGELANQFDELQKTLRYEYDSMLERNREQLDEPAYAAWGVKARSLLEAACGKDSVHLSEFTSSLHQSYLSSAESAKYAKAIFDAAREDFDGGYLSHVRNMVRAEVFSSELDQARELLANSYAVPAAVVAGTVLETTLRDLCDKHGLQPTRSLEAMNVALAKASEYSVLVQKRVTALAAIRNAAAHGDHAQFRAADVEPMIRDIERFVSDHPVI